MGQIKVFTSATTMPFGYYKGTPLGEVAPWYLLHLWESLPDDTPTNKALRVYIDANLASLRAKDKGQGF